MRNVDRVRTCFFNTLGPGTVGAGITTYGAGTVGSSLQGTETNRQSIIPKAGTFIYAYVATATAQSANNSMVFTLRKNNADTTIVITVAAGSAAGTFTDLTHSFTSVAGDKSAWKIVNNANVTSAQLISVGVYYNS